MPRTRRALTIIFTTLFVVSGSISASAGPVDFGYPNKGIWITPEATSVNPSHFSLVNYELNTSQNCNELGQSPCTEQNMKSVVGSTILGVCTQIQESFCIESLAISSKSISSQGRFVEYAGSSRTKPFPAFGVPEGFDTSLWQVAGVSNSSGSDTYAVEANLSMQFDSEAKPIFNDLSVSVVPYSVDFGGQYNPRYFNGNRIEGGGFNNCFWYKVGSCGLKASFGDESRVTLKLRVPDSLGGWYRGRIGDPDITLTPLGNKQNLLSVAADPMQTPYLQVGLSDDDSLGSIIPGVPLQRNSVAVIRSHFEMAPIAVKLLRDYAKDKVTGMVSLWSFSNLNQAGFGCLHSTTKVMGFVSTDALAYNGQAPSFKNGVLTYDLSGLHFKPDGTPVEGRYDLVIRSDAARCLYGFTSAPVYASISVVDSAGETKVSSTSMREKNGWIYLSAAGFGYSTPKIQMKLSQPKPAKKSTITCVTTKKPIKTKKITAVGPKCPTGFKKK